MSDKENELNRALAAAQLENQIYRDQIDALQASADERFDAMHEMLVGYILWKCDVRSVVIDPEEMQRRFPAMLVTKSLVNNNIEYRLENGEDL